MEEDIPEKEKSPLHPLKILCLNIYTKKINLWQNKVQKFTLIKGYKQYFNSHDSIE